MRLRRRPADDGVPHVVREDAFEVGAHVLGPDQHHAPARQPADARVECVGDAAPVPFDDLVDVALVARLRPASLVVPARHLLGLVRDLDEDAVLQAVDVAALAADGGDERRVAPPHEARERREVELGRDAHVVRNRVGGRQGAPEVVQPRREDRHPPGALPVEALVEPRLDPPEVALQRLACLAGEPALALLEQPLGPPDQRVDPRLEVRRRQHLARVEVQVQADRAPLGLAESGEPAELLPPHRPCHDVPPMPAAGPFYSWRTLGHGNGPPPWIV